ncbi:1-acyl-sn-glycerol-3-phosphate acyltransferase [Rivularia sp. PCC 7116]|uniref:lysophospholipid acyltransferase family protein n=1 Tax=Rivularia sp. PCC 7116 TaxID=373994 RepID=UPI00029F13F1|nr:1-acyl-sn-glycerol-3-phosphate acyltransferase [Rivularia sp. PCC 7116]AFY54032.1 1-acyl-sn-glycerol-3-phosphate acyltransferase [Rivularia sp. PCC 7116]
MMEFDSIFDTGRRKTVNSKITARLADTNSRISPWLSSLTYLLAGNILLPFYFSQITIVGQENLPKSGPVILAPTHKARWDSLLLPYATGRGVTGRDLRFMVTSTECRGFQGWFVRRLGGFPVNSQRPSITTLRHTVELLKRGEMLVIYPEGGIFRDSEVHPLKPGIGRLALSAESSHPGLGVKIVPICFNYSHPYPDWGTDVSISIAPAIKVSDYAQGCVKHDAKKLTDDLAHALQQLNYQYDDLASSAFMQIES